MFAGSLTLTFFRKKKRYFRVDRQYLRINKSNYLFYNILNIIIFFNKMFFL